MSDGVKELAYRAGAGVEVALFWSEDDGRLSVVVNDWQSGDAFEIDASRENALDVFNHPFAYRRAA
jgi:hypothetical protein